MTPNLAIIHVQNSEWRSKGFKLWVPLFLLWIPLILLSPLILLVVFAACIAGEIDPFYALRAFWDIACGLRGTDVRVTADGNKVLVRIL
jgi:hypothetical protein